MLPQRCRIALFAFLLSVASLPGCAQKGRPRQEPPPSPPLEEKIGQMLMVGFRGLTADNGSAIAASIADQHIGGVVLFDYDVPTSRAVRNIKSPEQLRQLSRQLQRRAKRPLLIAVDQEGGMVSRLKAKYGFPPTVSARYLGKLNNIDSTRYYARRMAQALHDAGINTNLAPVVDLNINPDNPVIGALERSFSADPEIVTRHARAFIEAFHAAGILTTLKHFPGHGSSRKDSHKGLVDVTDTWQRRELIPYRRLIDSGHADLIMTAHIYNARLDTVSATLSENVITGMLRDSLGFDGVVISDDLQMGAIRNHYDLKETIRMAIQAGVDMLCFANNSVYDEKIAVKAQRIIHELIDEGAISRERIDRSYRRIMELKERI